MPDPHAGFIIAAYGLAFLVILGMILAILLDHRAQKRALAKLEARAAADETP